MIRSLARSLVRFFAACVLFVLVLCAVEVGIRYSRLKGAMRSVETAGGKLPEFVRPHETRFLDVAPLLDANVQIGQDQYVSIKTNEFGLRGESITVPKPAGTYRILCLGGTGLFGIQTDQTQTVPAQLQVLFLDAGHHHVEVLNSACPNAGPLINYLRLRQSLLVLEPDLVIYTLNLHDSAFDAQVLGGLIFDSLGRPAFAQHPQFTGMKSSTLSQISQEFATADWILGRSGAAVGIKPTSTLNSSLPTEYETTIRALREIDRLLAANGCRLIVSILPISEEEKTGGDPEAILATELLKPQTNDVATRELVIHRPLELSNLPPNQDNDQRPKFGMTPLETQTYTLSIATFLATKFGEILEDQPQTNATTPSTDFRSATKDPLEELSR